MMAMNAAAFEKGDISWLRAHEALSRLARARARADAEEGRWLLAALRSAVHVHLGFGAFGEYVERLFGYGRRFIREKLRVAEALEQLPLLAAALEDGVLGWSALRELTRVAVVETEAEWLAVAKGKTARQLEELVAGKRLGDTPESPPDPRARRHVLRFEVQAETFAIFRQAVAELRCRSGSGLDDDAVLMEMARQVLGGPLDDGRANYQIGVSLCAECGVGHLDAGPDAVAVGSDVIAMASCDAQHLGRVAMMPANDAECAHVGRGVERAGSTSVGPASSNHNQRAQANVVSAMDAAGNSGEQRPRQDIDAAVVAAATACNQCPQQEVTPLVGTASVATDQPARQNGARAASHASAYGARAKQTVPPSVRRAVLRRDHGCCRVPGCRNSRFLDVHHIELRSEGGGHRADNLVTVCGAHHRALHRGELVLDSDGSGEVHFRHADGSVYGGVANPRTLDTIGKLFSALRGLGFREGEVQRTLGELRGRKDLADASLQDWLRAALQRLTPVRR